MRAVVADKICLPVKFDWFCAVTGYRREMAEDQFLGAGKFQPKPPCLEPRVFVGLLIMSNDILKMSLFADCHIFHASGDQE